MKRDIHSSELKRENSLLTKYFRPKYDTQH